MGERTTVPCQRDSGCWRSADLFETLPDVARRGKAFWLAEHARAYRLGAMNIRTIVLVILGLVLVSAIVLSTTALASVLILGDFHWKRVVVAAGFWLLVLGCIAAMYRGGVKRRTPGGHHP